MEQTQALLNEDEVIGLPSFKEAAQLKKFVFVK
jgi:hypothetical protein